MSPDLPLSAPIGNWVTLATAAGIFLGTFLLEDAAALAAGLAVAAGHLAFAPAFLATFLGIWLGDAGLYALARWAGRDWFARSRWARLAPRVAASERWFQRHGAWILLGSRLLPGARLPTFLAAGFLRLPGPVFLGVTGLAASLWTFMILQLAARGGAGLDRLAALAPGLSIGLVTGGVLLLLAIRLRPTRWPALVVRWRRGTTALGRWRHWEFWPAWVFYPPVVLQVGWLACKYRGLTLPTAANPGIETGGLIGESKATLLHDLLRVAPEFTAAAELIPPGPVSRRLERFRTFQRAHPDADRVVLKPDVGQRGVGVKVIRSEADAADYFRRCAAPLVVQCYVPGPFEAGVFYYRLPHEPRGRIFAITEKVFPELTGDGERTVAELIDDDPRARYLAALYRRRFAARIDTVLARGERLRLVEAGNHAQGCIFRDGARLGTAALEARLDAISRALPGFFIGRYDIRYADEADFRAGTAFKILELNGAAAEATSIYDARTPLAEAYRTLYRQWELVFRIGAANRRQGAVPTSLPELVRRWRSYARQAATYPAAD